MRLLAFRLFLWHLMLWPAAWLDTAAQEIEPGRDADGALRVFLDCRHVACDSNHLRREIPFVDYVRDPADADVHVLVRTQPTGPGGTEFSLSFIGRRRFAESEELVR